MTPAEQLKEIASRSIALYDCSVRQVEGGFVLNASTRYLEPETGGVQAQISHESTATDAAGVAAKVEKYLTTGKFA